MTERGKLQEIRLMIFELVFDPGLSTAYLTPRLDQDTTKTDDQTIHSDNNNNDHTVNHATDPTAALDFDHEYTAQTQLRTLYTCRQIYHDAHLLAYHRTAFTCANLFVDLATRLDGLPGHLVRELRHVALVVDARHFRKLNTWRTHPFGNASLHLDSLTFVLHRSSFWHYLFDFTADLVALLRQLRGVRQLVFVRNGARVKGSFKSWCNRLIGLIMKVDHRERHLRPQPNPEQVWWTWKYDEGRQILTLDARPPKPWMSEENYLQSMLPLLNDLRASIETEEWNPDPRSRNGA